MADEKLTSEVEVVDKASASFEKMAKAGRTYEGAALAVVSAEKQRENATARATTAFEKLERRFNPLGTAIQSYNRGLTVVERATNQTAIAEERLAAVKQHLTDRFEAAERSIRGNATAYEKLRNSLDPVTRAEREFANSQDVISKALERGEISAKGNAEELERIRARLDDTRRATQQQTDAYGALQARLNPTIVAERDFAAAITTVNDALQRGRIGGQQAKEDVAALRVELEKSRAALDTTTNEFEALQGKLNPVIAAEREFATEMAKVNRFLGEHSDRAEEASAAEGLLRRRLEETKASANSAQNEFQQLFRSIDRVTAAEHEHARATQIVNRYLKETEHDAEAAARAMRLLDQRLEDARRGAGRFGSGADGLGRSVGRLNLAFSAGAGLITAFTGAFVTRELIKFNDVMQQSANRLRIVTDSAGQLVVSQDALFDSSQKTYTSILGGVEIYERLARSTKNLEISNQRLLGVTEAIQESVALSGTTALAANAALIQFGQGLAADSLRGQELNSVMEQTPRLARALAEGLGVGIGQLRQMANQGELTAEKVITAIENQADVIESEFARIDPTFAQVATTAENAATRIGAAFAEPIIDEFKTDLKDLVEILNSDATKEGAQAFGNSIAAALRASRDEAGGLLKTLSDIANFGPSVTQRAADLKIAEERGRTLTTGEKLFVGGVLGAGQAKDPYVQALLEIRREQITLEREAAQAAKEFKEQESFENFAAALGLSATKAKDLREEFERAKLNDDFFNLPILRQVPGLIDEARAAAMGLGVDGVEAVKTFFDAFRDKTPELEKALEKLKTRRDELAEKDSGLESKDAAEIVSYFEKTYGKAFTPEQRARVAAVAAEIENLAGSTKDASAAFEKLALAQRALPDLREQAEAAQQGPEALKFVQEEQALQKELISLEAEAIRNKTDFNRANEEANLRAIQYLERQADVALAAFEKLEKFKEKFLFDSLEKDVDRLLNATRNGTQARGFTSGSAAVRDATRDRAIDALNKRLAAFNEKAAEVGLSPEQIERLDQVITEGYEGIYDAHREGGDYVAERITDATREFAESVLEDLIFNQGRGLNGIFAESLRRDVRTAIIDPLSKFLSGQSESGDLFTDIGAGLDEVNAKFGRIGSVIDDLVGTGGGGIFEALAGQAGEALALFKLGSGAADLINGKQGETGSAIGGALGGVIAGPLGAAVGGFLGDIIGGLFGRKTATGSIDFDTGEIFGEKDSKKDSRNARRDQILETSLDAIQRLAEVLDADIKNRIALEVNAGKKAIELDLIDPVTGRVIVPGGKVDDKDVQGAINRAIKLALDSVLEGGDERLTRIAKALSSVNVPAEKVLSSIEEIAGALDIVKEPSSEFRDAIDAITDVFGDAISLAERYATATRDITEAQLEAVEAIAGKFDETIEEATRRLTDPIGQDALDLAKSQQERIKDATAINDALAKALADLNRSPAASTVGSGFDPNLYLGANPDVEQYFAANRARLQQFASQDEFAKFHFDNFAAAEGRPSGAVAQAETVAEATQDAADAQERLNAVLELNTEEWKAFIRNAGDTPAAFRAAAAAIEEMRAKASELGIDMATIAETLEEVRAGLAGEFDRAERRRGLEFTNPLAIQVEEILDAQIERIQAAKDVSSGAADEQARLARVFENNQLEFAKFIESAGDTPDAIGEVVEALEKLRDRADEVGLSISQIDALQSGAVSSAGGAFLEKIQQDFDRFTNEPVANFKALLEAQAKLNETAEKFAALKPDEFGGLPVAVRNRNTLERQRFLEALSDEDKLRLGDFVGLIEDYGGRIDVVSTQLRDTLEKLTGGVKERIEELDKTIDNETEFAERIGDTKQSLLDQYFPGSRTEAFAALKGRVENLRLEALAGNESAETALPNVITQLVQRAADRFGTASPEFTSERDRAFSILDEVKNAALARAETARTEKDILEADLAVSENILKSFETVEDNTAYLKDILETGKLQNELANAQIAELIALRAAQSGQDLSIVTRLGSVEAGSAPIFEDAPAISTQEQQLASLTRETPADTATAGIEPVAQPTSRQTTAQSVDLQPVALAIAAMDTGLGGLLKDIFDEIVKLREELAALRAADVQNKKDVVAAINPNTRVGQRAA